MLAGPPFVHVDADFTENRLHTENIQAIDLCQVNASNAIEGSAQIILGTVLALASRLGWGKWYLRRIDLRLTDSIMLLNLMITGDKLRSIEVVGFDGLTQGEEMFALVITVQ